MKTNYIEVNEVHTFQAYEDVTYIGCSVYDNDLNSNVEIMLRIPTQIYLEDFAGNPFKNIAKEVYKKHLDNL